MKAKVFYAVNNQVQVDEKEENINLEDALNKWLSEENPEIVGQPLQDASGRLDHHVTITIFYKS